MAVRNRSTSTAYVNEVNTDGVATQKELNDKLIEHVNIYHVTEDGIDYFWDTKTNQYLSKQWFTISFSDVDKTTKNIYLYQKKNIRCNDSYTSLPFGKDMLIDKIQVSLDSPKSGDLFDIDDDQGNTLFTLNVPNNDMYNNIEDIQYVLPHDKGFRIYVNNITIRKPVLNVWIRLIKGP